MQHTKAEKLKRLCVLVMLLLLSLCICACSADGNGGNTDDDNGKNDSVDYDIKIYTDIATSPVVNDVVNFTAYATLGQERCNIVVTFGDKLLDANGETYGATLEKGKNVFIFVARKGDKTETRTEEILYDGFKINADLKEVYEQKHVEFRCAATYGDNLCDVSVTVGGVACEKSGNKFAVDFPCGGEYEIVVVARRGNMSYVKTFAVTYSDGDPYFDIFTLTDGKQFKGDRASFDVSAKNALGKKIDDSALSFYADFDADDGVDNFVALGSNEISKIWGDNVKTSYRISFEKGRYASHVGVATVFRAAVAYGEKTVVRDVRITYVGADSDGSVGSVTLSIEGFTVGAGYLLAPTEIKVYTGVNFARYLTQTITANGWSYKNTGTIDSGFYLASISGVNLDGNCIDANLKRALTNNNVTVFADSILPDDNGVYSLGEFDFAQGSGWMYSVNGSFPNYGFADYMPQDGDTVRVQFTLALGADLGGSDAVGFGSKDYTTNNADYAEFNALAARIAANDCYGKDDKTLKNALAMVSVWDVAQAVVDNQAALLRTFYNI